MKQRSAYGKPGLSVWGQYLSSWLVPGAWLWQHNKHEQNNKQNQNEIHMLSNMVCSWFCWCKSNRICKLIQTILQCATPAWTLAVCLCCTLWGWRMGCAWWSDCSRFGVGPPGLCAGRLGGRDTSWNLSRRNRTMMFRRNLFDKSWWC